MLSPNPTSQVMTQREFNVAYLKAKGKANKEIAQLNRMTFYMVQRHLRNIKQKVGTNGAIGLRKIFESEGLL